MFLLGIDIAKLNHVASCIDSSTNEVIFSNFKFKNDFKGFSALLNKIKSFDAKNLIIGLESTSHYGENFYLDMILKLHLLILYKLHIWEKLILEMLKMIIWTLLILLNLYFLLNLTLFLKKTLNVFL